MILGPDGTPLPESSPAFKVTPRTGPTAVSAQLYDTPEKAKAKTQNIMERVQAQLEMYGGVESLDFLDMPMDLFNTMIYTLWWGRKYA